MINIAVKRRWLTHHSVLALCSIMFMQISNAMAAEVTVEWDEVPDPRIGHYEVHWGSSRGNYIYSVAEPSPPVTITDLTDGQSYYLAVRACKKDSLNCSGFSNEVATSASEVAPEVTFSADAESGLAPLTVKFTNTSSDAISYAWDFGDGETSTAEAPSHTYTAQGTYTASLMATGDGGTSTDVKGSYITVDGADISPATNPPSDRVTVIYLPGIADTDADGMPDGWEDDHSVGNPGIDDDLDGISNIDEFKAGTDPWDKNSKPEGANSISYVLFRDHFDDSQYQYRWHLTALDVTADHTLYESGTEIQTTLQSLEPGCAGLRLESFSSVDADSLIYHASLLLNGYGQTALGLMRDIDQNNRIEVLFDNDNELYLLVRSVDNGTVVDMPATLPGSYQGAAADIRIVKTGAQYSVTVDGFTSADFTNNGLGNSAIRPYIAAEQCDTDMGYVDSLTDIIELLRDSDADGEPDLEDNCINAANPDQRDTDGDNYGNACDADLNQDGIINGLDIGPFKSVFGTAASNIEPLTHSDHADFNGDGVVNGLDVGSLKAQFGKAPGPSCCGNALP